MEKPHEEQTILASYHLQVAELCEHAAKRLEQHRIRCTDFVRRRVICEQISRHKESAEFHRDMAQNRSLSR